MRKRRALIPSLLHCPDRHQSPFVLLTLHHKQQPSWHANAATRQLLFELFTLYRRMRHTSLSQQMREEWAAFAQHEMDAAGQALNTSTTLFQHCSMAVVTVTHQHVACMLGNVCSVTGVCDAPRCAAQSFVAV